MNIARCAATLILASSAVVVATGGSSVTHVVGVENNHLGDNITSLAFDFNAPTRMGEADENHPQSSSEDEGCDEKVQELDDCFLAHGETNSELCWEGCVLPAYYEYRHDTCDGFCAGVERCRGDRCSSGPACEGQYRRLLNCIMEHDPDNDDGCTCEAASVETNTRAAYLLIGGGGIVTIKW